MLLEEEAAIPNLVALIPFVFPSSSIPCPGCLLFRGINPGFPRHRQTLDELRKRTDVFDKSCGRPQDIRQVVKLVSISNKLVKLSAAKLCTPLARNRAACRPSHLHLTLKPHPSGLPWLCQVLPLRLVTHTHTHTPPPQNALPFPPSLTGSLQ